MDHNTTAKNPGVLVLNCGSSSVKFSLIDLHADIPIIVGLAEYLNTAKARINWKNGETKGAETIAEPSHKGALAIINKIIQPFLNQVDLRGIGHRVVHGGEYFTNSIIIDTQVIDKLKECSKFAPLHNPANILGIESAMELFPGLPQVAVFDTAFHQTMPDYVYHYALPYEWYQNHKLRRYGFHGTSHRYVTAHCAVMLNKPLASLALLSAHLGNGCSASAVLGGKSLDTTMGFTPLEGLVMGTRCGDIDPSIAEFIANEEKINIAEITNIYNKKSGLLGISGISHDMRELLEAGTSGNERANLAIEIYCYRLAKHLAGLIVPLGRVDALIFTGGVGENESSNKENGKSTNGRITMPNSSLAMVIPTNEEGMIAKDTMAVINK
jgi:acetate kinase